MHIVDFDNNDACDMAMENDFIKEMYEFVNCNVTKKIKVQPGSFIPPISETELFDMKMRNNSLIEFKEANTSS